MMAQAKKNASPAAARVDGVSEKETDSTWSVYMAATQHEDEDLRMIITALEAGQGKPAWNEVSDASTEAKQYWSQWELLRMQNGILQRRWESVNGNTHRWLIVVPRSDMRY